ncbi:MAG: PEGA domain-containing protein [candidate division Zixibacteria bacterium]|nr:PEGA domain-containing protein [candidate division Zixibacteria bacterium]
MKLALKWILAMVVFCLIWQSTLAIAQSHGNVVINSTPQGAFISLKGQFHLSGVTPVKFSRSLSGRYEVIAMREGYETYKSVEYFSETQNAQLDIVLKKKTRSKAFFRSLIVPGWGQRYYGNSKKSTLITLGAIASTAGYLVAKDNYDSKVDKYTAAKTSFAEALRWEDVVRTEAEVRRTQKDANDAEDKVNIMIAATVGVYVFNLLDTILLFPEYSSYSEYKAITASPFITEDQVGLTLSLRF